ncbi:hypothetical protein [Carboxylicivirga sp. RSCT41]|uniref:hypothetical protein n=1 Tax=Carboxylicivirga agarovorans TaxID=3417570 RepID=UPI003D34C49F
MIEVLIFITITLVTFLIYKWFNRAFLLRYIAISVLINALSYVYILYKNYDSLLSDVILVLIISLLIGISLAVLYSNYQKHKIQLSHIGRHLGQIANGQLSSKLTPIKSSTENEVSYISQQLDRASNQIYHTINAANYSLGEISRLSNQLSEVLSNNNVDHGLIEHHDKKRLDQLSTELKVQIEALRHVLTFFN